MKRLRIGVLVAALIAVAALVAGAGGFVSKATSATPKVGGTMVFGAEQEPPCLNNYLSGCNNTWTAWTTATAFRGLYIENPDFTLTPDMAAGEATVTTSPKFTLTVTIKKQAVWNDGVPVTWRDFWYTWQTQINPKNDNASTSGWTSISAVTPTSKDGKTFKIIFKQPYAPWKVLLSDQLYPWHADQGSDFNNLWLTDNKNPKNGQPIGDGPFIVTNYTKGQSITMTRNPKWWGPHKPYLDKVVFVFRTDTDTEIQAIRGGEVQAIYPQPQLQLADLKSQSGLTIQSNAGTTLEHIDFNEQLKGGQPLLRLPWFREAVAYSIDRPALVKQLFQTLNPKLKELDNLTYGNSQKEYVPHFQVYQYSPSKVSSMMTAHQCKKGGDGIWSCPVNGNPVRASIKFGTTAGNKLRELAQEIMQAQAKNAGIELVPDNSPSRIFFPAVSDGNYQMALFAWVGSGDPAGQVDIYGCQGGKPGGSNWKGYCSTKVTALLTQSDKELDPQKRINEVNAADANMALNVPTLPLYQKPTYFVFSTKLHGARDNPTLQGPTDNMQDWWLG
jgi:peptide/nickel transport system substrate-binding protein